MTTYQYKNATKADLVLIGVGVVLPGGTIESEEPIENSNLTPIEGDAKKKLNKESDNV